MCNLYRMNRTQDEVRRLFDGAHDRAGNLPDLPSIYPDQTAPIVRNCEDGPELVQARWGMPTPAFFLRGKAYDSGITNIRKTNSPHWQQWLTPRYRCLVPWTAFAEPMRGPDGKSRDVWFDLGEDEPLAFFAGVSVANWTSVRKVREGKVTADLYAFLTTSPNAEVGEVHRKAMPVVLTDPLDWQAWLTRPWSEVAHLQRPLPKGSLRRHLPPEEAQPSLF